MKIRLFLAVLLGIVLVVAGVLWFQKGEVDAPSPPAENAQDLPLSTEEVTITGEVICLPHKVTTGPQTLECAIGIKDDNGVNYALQADDPSLSGSLTGRRVQATGRLHQADPESRYNTAGTLHVQSIKQQ